jgi:mannitol/fructose-specific phosphotransferase system IIA component (Ntr-type)
MKICKYLQSNYIYLDIPLADKTALLRFVAEVGKTRGIVQDAAALYDGLRRREQIMSTGIGGGLALPHTMSPEIEEASVFLVRPERAIEFEALDEKPVDVALVLLFPDDQPTLHLRLLAGISRLCKETQVMKSIREAKDGDILWKNLCGIEDKMAFH